MKAVVLLNEKSGACAVEKVSVSINTIREALAAVGVEADVRCVAGDDLACEATTAAASGVDVVIAGGGDGTISAVAGALAGGETPLGVLPRGTLNHFAKDLGVPLDLAGAVRVIGAGRIARVDVGVVNGRVFVNNSSLGVYARALLDRDATRDRWGWGKWQAMALAALWTFWRSPMLHVRLDAGDGAATRKTPLVFVGNNRYRLDLMHVGARDRLDGGELYVCVANTSTRWGMLKLIVRAALGRLEQSRDFETLTTQCVTIESRRSQLPIAVDGEVLRMAPPYEYRIWTGALKVIVLED